MRPGLHRLALLMLVALGALSAPGAAAAQQSISATVSSTPTGQPMPPGFVGVSLEYSALHLYTGRDPSAVNPVLIQLLRALAPGQTPVLRIGGDSADATWWPMRGVVPPGGVQYALTPGWLRTTRALASALGARLIMGINLAAGRPALAATEARALLQGIGSQYLDAFEIGNEPDVYGMFPWYHGRRGRSFYARAPGYSLSAFIREFARWRAALPALPVAGPAFAELTWLSGLSRFLAGEPHLQVVTVHRYPLRAGVTDPASILYPSIANLLNDRSSAGLAQQVAPYVAQTHAAGLPFRLDEMNSAAHEGQPGVSNAFASALWVLDTLFNLAAVGVDGINVHSLPGAAYELFTFSRHFGRWQAFVHPEYYGMLMFSQAFTAGAQMLPVDVPDVPLKVWATEGPDGHVRVMMINKDPANEYEVQLHLPNSIPAEANVERLQAPSLGATTGVTLGGAGFGDETTTGTLGTPQTEPVMSFGGTFTVDVPAGSAALLTQ